MKRWVETPGLSRQVSDEEGRYVGYLQDFEPADTRLALAAPELRAMVERLAERLSGWASPEHNAVVAARALLKRIDEGAP